MLNIVYSKWAENFLKKLEKYISLRILERINKLKDDPVPSDARFIGRDKGEKLYRYRIGDYRALYKLKELQGIILIIKIDKRSKIYD